MYELNIYFACLELYAQHLLTDQNWECLESTTWKMSSLALPFALINRIQDKISTGEQSIILENIKTCVIIMHNKYFIKQSESIIIFPSHCLFESIV